MSPSQSGMILRSLERIEAAQTTQAKQIKMLEVDNELMSQRMKALSEENVQLALALANADKMIEQLIRRGAK